MTVSVGAPNKTCRVIGSILLGELINLLVNGKRMGPEGCWTGYLVS